MKKQISIISILVLCLLFVSCANKKTDEPSGSIGEAVEPSVITEPGIGFPAGSESDESGNSDESESSEPDDSGTPEDPPFFLEEWLDSNSDGYKEALNLVVSMLDSVDDGPCFEPDGSYNMSFSFVDPDSRYYGIGRINKLPGLGNSEDFEIVIHRDWEPIYAPGSFWYELNREGFYALCYYESIDQVHVVNKIDVSNELLQTFNGIKVGDTKEIVKSVYPDLTDKEFCNDFGFAGDYLWMNAWGDDYDFPVGPNLFFCFEGDVLVKIILYNLLN